MQNEKSKPNWDTTFSTYYWELWYKSGKQPMSDGYSKQLNRQEAADKVRLLCRVIDNPFFRGRYIPDKCQEIIVRKKVGGMIRKDLDPVIMVLKPEGYERIDSTYVAPVVKAYLDEKYLILKTGQAPAVSVFPNRIIKNHSNEEIYRYAKKTNFLTYEDFFKTLLHLKSIGIDEGMLNAFCYAIQVAQPVLFKFQNTISQVHDFLKPEILKQKKLIPVADIHLPGASFNSKTTLGAVVISLKEKLGSDFETMPSAQRSALIMQQLQEAKNNINQQNQTT